MLRWYIAFKCCANNIGICCVETLRLFSRGFKIAILITCWFLIVRNLQLSSFTDCRHLICLHTYFPGEQKRRVFCVREDNGEEVFDSNCNDDEKPSNKQSCNSQPCPSRLVHGYRVGLDVRRKGNLGGAAYLVHLEKKGRRAKAPRGGGNRDMGGEEFVIRLSLWGRSHENFPVDRSFLNFTAVR